MATTVIFEIKTKPGSANEMLAMLKDILPDTRSYDGCLGVKTYQGQDDPNTMIIMGKWESKSHFEKYLSWRQESDIFDHFVAMIESPPNTRFFDLTGV